MAEPFYLKRYFNECNVSIKYQSINILLISTSIHFSFLLKLSLILIFSFSNVLPIIVILPLMNHPNVAGFYPNIHAPPKLNKTDDRNPLHFSLFCLIFSLFVYFFEYKYQSNCTIAPPTKPLHQLRSRSIDTHQSIYSYFH